MDWTKLSPPILALAPMEDVTDTVFRRIVTRCARPDVFFTEFTSVDGLFSKGKEIVAQRLAYTEEERPIVAQVWGSDPDAFYKAVPILVERGFDGIDINMGCPQRNVIKHGGGACLIDQPALAREIIEATREGIKVSDAAGRLAENYMSFPLSVKTRLGNRTIETVSWVSHLLSCDIDALIIHGRTAKELSKVPAHWDEIGRAVAIRNQMKKHTVIIGNGDVRDYHDAMEKVKMFGVDGVMIGRGVFHNLWAFEKSHTAHEATLAQRLAVMKEHIELFDETWGAAKNFVVMKKFFKMYIAGFENASAVRDEFMKTTTAQEALHTLLKHRESLDANTA